MAMKKCPLCGGKLDKNYCDSCGYSVPDEEDISALYNYDPSDYPQEEPAIREITPQHITDEIYPNRPEPVEFKVREEEKKDAPFVNPYAEQHNGVGNAGAKTPKASPYANNTPKQSGGQSPYAGPYINNNPPQNNPNQPQNPYANNGNFTPYTNTTNSSDGSFKAFMEKYWVILLIMLLMPRVLSLILGISMLRSVDQEFKKYMLIATVLLAIFSLW